MAVVELAAAALSALGNLGSTAISILAPYGVDWIVNKVKQGKGMTSTELHQLLSAIEQLKQDNIDQYNDKLSGIYPRLVEAVGSENLKTKIVQHNVKEKERYDNEKRNLRKEYQARSRKLANMSGRATGLAYSGDISNIGKMNVSIKDQLKEDLSKYDKTL